MVTKVGYQVGWLLWTEICPLPPPDSYQFSSVQGFPDSSDGKVSACNVGDPGSILVLGRSPGEENVSPLQYSCLENSMDWPWDCKESDMTEQLTLSLSVQFSRSVVSDSLQSHGLQHARLPCPSPTPSACSNTCPSSWWCHPTISSSVVPFSSCLPFFPASGSFLVSQFFTSGGQSIEALASASVLPMNIQNWFPLRLTGLTSLQSKESSQLKSLLQHHSSKVSVLWRSTFFMVQLSHSYMTTGKTIALTRWTFVGNVSAF